MHLTTAEELAKKLLELPPKTVILLSGDDDGNDIYPMHDMDKVSYLNGEVFPAPEQILDDYDEDIDAEFIPPDDVLPAVILYPYR